ncbi:hypothetical protein OWM07_04815 [Deferribacter thermophilus]|uniref:hypothetical protein n=1 Tax=Deferribacter thermophilus TaxID=53573 RepID=UPI003C19EF53
MCAGLIFHEGMKKQEIKVFFPRPYAKIYYLTKDGNKDTAIWGIRNEKEKEELKVNLPITGWSKIESIKKGYWDKYNPEKVYIPAVKYMEKDQSRKSHWFDLENDEFLLGILIEENNSKICYLVTQPSPERYRHIHDRWVMITKVNNLLKYI